MPHAPGSFPLSVRVVTAPDCEVTVRVVDREKQTPIEGARVVGTLPAGVTKSGLPVGLQLIGRYFDEARLLNVAHQYQQVTDWHRRIPKEFE